MKIEPLNDSERNWVQSNIKVCRSLARAYGMLSDNDATLDPTVLDELFAAWLDEPLPNVEPNDVIKNAIGMAFGQCVADCYNMDWVAYTESGQTDIAVHRQPGDVILCPTNLVGKRYPTRQTHFLQPVFDEVASIISMTQGESGVEFSANFRVSAEPLERPSGDSTRPTPWWKRWLGRA